MTTGTVEPRIGFAIRHSMFWPAAACILSLVVGAAAGRSLALAVGIVLVAVVSCAVVLKPFVGVAVLVALTPVTAGIKRGLVFPHLRPSEALIVWLVPLVLLASRRPVRQWSRLEWLGLAYAGATLFLGSFDLWRRGAPFDTSNVDGMVGPFEYLLLLRAVRVGVRTANERITVVRILLLVAVPICLFALLQGSGFVWAQHLRDTLVGFNPQHLNRATGLFTNWQVLAGYLLSVGMVAMAVVAFKADRIFPVPAATLISAVIGAGLLRTLTIGAFAGWLVGGFTLLVLGRQIRLTARRACAIGGGGVLLLATVLAARYKQEFVARPGQTGNGLIPNTIADRVGNWTNQYLPALSGRWTTGFGPDIPPNATWKYTDSVYVTLVLRGGLLLFGVYVALMDGFLSVARRVRESGAEARASAAALGVLVVLLVPLQTIATYFTTSGLPEVIWTLAALVSTWGFDESTLA